MFPWRDHEVHIENCRVRIGTFVRKYLKRLREGICEEILMGAIFIHGKCNNSLPGNGGGVKFSPPEDSEKVDRL
jgi:hypothetical protein